MPPPGKSRLCYVDYIKALTIIGVVNVHSHIPPSWITALLVNAIFFFLAGMFFKMPDRAKLISGYGRMLEKDCKSLLIPFAFFYTLSYPFRIIVHMWDHRTLAGFDWWCFFDLFDISGPSDYLFVNVPLWFILCLFVVKCIYYWVRCLPDSIICVAAVAVLGLRDVIGEISTPFMINNAFYWLGFFALGNLFACHVVPHKMIMRWRLVIAGAALVVLLMTMVPGSLVSEMGEQYIRVFATLMLLLFGASLLEHVPNVRAASFIGKNTLIILGCHIWFLIPLGRISYKLTGEQTVWTGLVQTVLCMLFCWLFILISNRYFPSLVGKPTSQSKSV